MTDKAQLLERVLASRHFTHAETLKAILRHVAGRPPEQEGEAFTEYDIAVGPLARPLAFDPKLDPVVRVCMTSVRRRLDAYFEDEGRAEPVRLQISKGQYRAVYTPNERPRRDPAGGPRHGFSSSVEKFWRPYFLAASANVLVHGEQLIPHGGSAPSAGHGYVPVGTVDCMFALVRLFYEANAPVALRSARSCTWHELRQSGLVLVGSAGGNSYVRALQGRVDFVLDDDCIRNLKPRAGEEPEYRGERYMDGNLPRHRQYAVVTRRPGLAPGGAITIIGAVHGKAIEGAGQFVTSEQCLGGVLEQLGRRPGDGFPAHFQVVVEVEMIDVTDEVVHVRAVAHRALDGRPG